jgi:hypothetical protein
LELGGFYSAPQPLQYFHGISSLTPKPLYRFYEEQARELQVLSARIMALTRVIKIRGGYDKNVSGLEKMLDADENELVAVDGLLAAAGSGQGAGGRCGQAQSRNRRRRTTPAQAPTTTVRWVSQ